MIVHGDEALLAIGFIFTIHFFNGHLRPEKFPMDLVIFTGRLPEHELKDERQVEYARLVSQGRLGAIEASAADGVRGDICPCAGKRGADTRNRDHFGDHLQRAGLK